MSTAVRILLLLVPLLSSNTHATGQQSAGLVDMAGNTTNIEAHAGDGKWLVVMLWSVTCGICAHEVPIYSKFHNEQKERNIRVLGIALDGYEKKVTIEETMNAWEMHFPTLIADLGQFAASYQLLTGEQLLGTPTFLVYTPEGRLVANNPGPMRISALVDYIAKRQAGN